MKERHYNYFYPLKVWVLTNLTGTVLHIMTSGDGHIHPTAYGYFGELLNGIVFSMLTLIVSYFFYFVLINWQVGYKTIKPIIALVGSACCVLTISYKFDFAVLDFENKEYLNLAASFCLPLIAGTILFSVKDRIMY